ncbi:uncharacterized protein LOC125198147 [Salvia hispanica]|uniref:uncharacterized protein LOC125198147 n=1 Tax=Salvia hispanica TaxID=49212 RepID=UPI002009CC75|nr:uncharacterized protein LOC125198147 [Salvia hispanica]
MSSDSSSRAQSDEEISHSSSEEEVPPAPTGWDVAGFANNPINNYISRRIQSEIARMQQPPPQRPIRRRRRYIPRNHTGAHDRLFADYFAEEPRYPADVFRRRFVMRRSSSCALLMRCPRVTPSSGSSETQRREARTIAPTVNAPLPSHSLAYGGSADMFDEYLAMRRDDGNECLKNFCQGVREIFGEHYLRSPDARIDWPSYWIGTWRTHGFPGMLGKHRSYAPCAW